MFMNVIFSSSMEMVASTHIGNFATTTEGRTAETEAYESRLARKTDGFCQFKDVYQPNKESV
jgi:hypothetical protein